MISTLNSSKICTAQKRQLTKALPIMAKAANTPELQSAFTAHLKEREEQLVPESDC
jgi:ferritin-like metal-binding protein YciE